MRKGRKLSPQSHFTCLFHDHAKCSCIGGPRRLVQSHFTCHSHEWSSSLFFVMHVHCTYTSIRVSCMPSCLLHTAYAILCLHRSLSSVSCCSSVSVSTDVIRRNVFPYVQNYFETTCISRLHLSSYNKLPELFPTTVISRPSCRHISSTCCLPLLYAHAALSTHRRVLMDFD